MADIVSFRFKEHELGHIQKLSIAKKVDKTAAARELIEYGWRYYVLSQYKEGRLSLEKTAKELHTSISELMDLLADMGMKSPIAYEDYLEGLKNIT
ncbi:hypothetical protein J4211_03980 [Candidatus Woesearchaeota archaeon]|nr:hypothetical protein [Candidatus Woesearchaeota archaeon]